MEDTPVTGFAGEAMMLIARNLRRIAFFCLAVAVAVAAYSLVVKHRYTAFAVAIVPGSATVSGLGSLTSLLPGDLGSSLGDLVSNLPMDMGMSAGADLNVVMMVLGSRPVMERVVIRYDLMRRWGSRSMEDALKKLSKRLVVSRTPEGMFMISAQGETSEEAASMAGDVIDFANETLSGMVTSRARRARIEAELILGQVVDSLETARLRLSEFRSSTGLLLPEVQGQALVQMLAQVEAEMILARSELAGATATLSPASPTAREISARIAALETSLRQRLGTGDSLSVLPGYASLPEDIRIFEDLFLEVEMRTGLLIMLRQQLETLRIQEAHDSPTLELVEPPTAPKHRSYPKRATMVVVFTFIAFVTACVWLVTVAYFRRVMRNPANGAFWRSIMREVRSQAGIRPKTSG